MVTFSFSNVAIAGENKAPIVNALTMLASETTTGSQIKIHFQKPTAWNSARIYYYDQQGNIGSAWPGENMTLEGDGWYTHTIQKWSEAKVLFNDGGNNQIPAKNQEGFEVKGDMWYRDGSWYQSSPENIKVYFYKPTDWQNAHIYYYKSTTDTGPAWPGKVMTSEGNGWYSYEINQYDTAKVIFNDGKGSQLPPQNTPGFDVTGQKWYKDGQWYNTKPEEKVIKLHFYKPETWGKVNAYYYHSTTQTGPAWPGEQMTSEGDGWYSLEITKYSNAKVLFNDGSGNQIPAKNQEGFNVTGEMWYRNGTWHTEKPAGTIVHYYKPDNWSAPNIYYYATTQDTGPAWPGEAMRAEEDNWYVFNINKYSEAKVLFNDGNYQIPSRLVDGFEVQGEKWYKDGTWYDEDPDSEIDYTKDTDGDSLLDYIEKEIGTSIYDVDTDGDRLPDGYEYFYLRTDPSKVDTDDNDIWDGDEDIDEDGLANIKEYELETNPFIADTDEDGLLDGDEVYKHSTNPLVFDTDNDGISDGDEIEISLDPNNPYTFGVPDSTYTIWQDAKEDILKNINEENNIYQFSVSLLASNNVQNYLTCQTSSYSMSLEDNRAILGKPLELLYNAGEVKEVNISFDLNPECLNTRPNYYPELNLGLDKYCIFTYNAELNLLYPIETRYNAETNTLSASVDTIGTFCVVDLESLIYDLGIDINDIDLEKESKLYTSASLMSNRVKGTSRNELVDNFEDLSLEEMKAIIRDLPETQEENVELTKSNMLRATTLSTVKQVDLVLVLDTTGSMGSQIRNVKANLVQLISDLRKEGISLYVSIVEYKDSTIDGITSTKVNYPKNVHFLNNTDDMLDVLNQITVAGGGDDPETVLDGLGATTNLKFRKNASKYAFVITDADYKVNNYYGITSLNEVAKKLNNLGVKSSVVTYSGYAPIYSPLYSETDGIWININGTFSTDMYNFILERTNQGAKYNAIVASGLVPVVLDEELIKGGKADTDKDGISDSDELNWEYIEMGVDTEGNSKIILPTIQTLLNRKLGYSTEGLEKVPLLNLILQIKVLPINSSPISEDGDGDYYKDSWDDNPLKRDAMLIIDDDIRDTFTEDTEVNTRSVPPVEKITDAIMKTKIINVPGHPTSKYAEFTRSTHTLINGISYDEFQIKVKHNSFYTCKLPDDKGLKSASVRIFKADRNGEATKNEINPVEQANRSWTFSLKEDKTYIIKVEYKTYQTKDYIFRVEQDNWVYAPNGGIWEKEDTYNVNNPGSLPYKQLYITPKLLVDATCGKIDNSYEPYVIYSENDLQKVMTMVSADLTSDENAKIGAGLTGVGFVVLFINPATGTLGAILTFVGNTATIGGGLTLGWNMLENMEIKNFERAIRSGNMHIYYNMYYLKMYNNYNSWNTSKYINRVQLGIPGKVSQNLTYQQVQEACRFTNYDN